MPAVELMLLHLGEEATRGDAGSLWPWTTAVDARTNRWYFANVETREREWTAPSNTQCSKLAAVWSAVVDAETGMFFYESSETCEQRWAPPERLTLPINTAHSRSATIAALLQEPPASDPYATWSVAMATEEVIHASIAGEFLLKPFHFVRTSANKLTCSPFIYFNLIMTCRLQSTSTLSRRSWMCSARARCSMGSRRVAFSAISPSSRACGALRWQQSARVSLRSTAARNYAMPSLRTRRKEARSSSDFRCTSAANSLLYR